jgi:hypothetical protein
MGEAAGKLESLSLLPECLWEPETDYPHRNGGGHFGGRCLCPNPGAEGSNVLAAQTDRAFSIASRENGEPSPLSL